ncbi:unnamed protein product, partial [Ilex paraguariensis]
IKWEPPPDGTLTLAAKGPTGLSGGGMVVRNSNGLIVVAAASFYDRGSNMLAECKALLEGIKLFLRHDLMNYQLLIESDSQVLVGMVLGKVKVPWKYKQFIDDICGILHRFNIKVSHIFREANGLADFLASYAVNEACCFEFLGTDSLPIAGKMRLHHDQLSLSTLRRKMILVDSTCRQLDTVDVRLNGRQEQFPLLVGLVLGSFCFGLVHVAGGLLRPAGFGLFTCTVHVHSLFNAAAGPHSSVIFYLQLGFDGLLPGFSAGLRQLSFLMVSAGSWSAAWPSLQAATVAGDCSRDCSRDLPGSCYSCFSAVIMLPSQLVSASHGFASVSWLWISFSCCSPRFQLTQLCFGSFGCFHTVAHGVQLDSQLDFQRLLCSYLAGFNGSPAGISAVSHPFYGLCAFACPDAAWIKANFGLSLFVQAILLLLALCTAVSFLATVPLGELFFFHVILIRKGITTYEYVVAMRTQSEAPGPSVDGGDLQSLPSSPTSSAMSGRSSLGMSLQYKGAWCTPPRIFMDHQDEIIPHLERDRLPSTVDPDSLPPPDKGKRLAQRPVRISAWKLAKLDSNESIKAGAKARASSSVLRPVSSRHHPYDSDHLSNSNVSGRSSPTSTNHGFHERNTRAGTSRLSSSKSSYPPSRASREDNEMCGHNISNLNSPHPPNLTPSPLEQLASNRDHFNPMYMSSVDRSPLSAKDANETAVSDVERVPMSRNLGAAENSRSSSVFWDQEAGRFVSAATRSVSSSSQVSGREPLTYAGQSIFYGGSPVDEQLSRGTRTGNSLPSDPERGSTSSYYRQGRSQRGGQLPVFVPSDSQHHQFSSTLR